VNKDTTYDTAILIFAKSAKAESKCLVRSNSVNHDVINLLNSSIENIAKQSGLPYILIDEKKQTGNNFGERLSNAFEQVYALGFDKVIAIGNDCPTITSDDLRQAHTVLKQHKAVVGPDLRGGIYLLGISKTNFNRSLIQGSNWQHKNTFSELQEVLDTPYTLKSKGDLNNKRDFQVFLRNSSKNSFLESIRLLIEPKKPSRTFYIIKKHNIAISNQAILRGPPSFLR